MALHGSNSIRIRGILQNSGEFMSRGPLKISCPSSQLLSHDLPEQVGAFFEACARKAGR